PVGLAVDDQRLARLDDPAGQAFAIFERRQLVAMLVGKIDDAGAPVEQRDIRDVGPEDRANLLADELEQVGEIELPGELLRDRVDGGELRRALLRFGEQARIFDRDRRLQRQPDQEFEIGVAKGLAAGAPHYHHALDSLPGKERRDHHPLVVLLLGTGNEKRARVGAGIIDALRATALDQITDDALAALDYRGLDHVCDV